MFTNNSTKIDNGSNPSVTTPLTRLAKPHVSLCNIVQSSSTIPIIDAAFIHPLTKSAI